MGQQHAKNVSEYLSNGVDPTVQEPRYGYLSLGMVRDIAFPSVHLVATLGVVYPAFLFVAELYLTFVG